jgi:site-specific recombinase XerD
MYAEGWDLHYISGTLGHKKYSTTVDRYGHITKRQRKEMADTTDKYCQI